MLGQLAWRKGHNNLNTTHVSVQSTMQGNDTTGGVEFKYNPCIGSI